MTASLSLALLVSAGSSAQPILRHYKSVEVMALSGATLVGTAVKIEPPAPGGEQFKVCVVFENCMEIDRKKDGAVYGAYLSVSKPAAEAWIAARSRILVFEGGSWINLDDPKEKIFDRWLRPIKGVEALVDRLRRVHKDHPEIERVRSFAMPLSREEIKRHGLEPDSRLVVPYDHQVEKWALRQIRSKDWVNRLHGVSALRSFESPRNIRLLKALLSDPYQAEDGSGRRPVREAAKDVLEGWGVKP